MTNAGINEDRTFGVELEIVSTGGTSANDVKYAVAQAICAAGLICEVQNYNHRTSDGWKIVHDASVHAHPGFGFELVSPILKGQDGIDQLRKVCGVLAMLSLTVNKTCGMHVHHGASDYNTKHLERIVNFYRRSEKQIDMLVAPSRRGQGNTYCQTLKGAYAPHVRGSSRYYKLNIQSYYRQGTIEFRQHQGTIDADKIIAWVAFTQAIVIRCKRAISRSEHDMTWYDVKQATGLVHKPELHEVARFLDARREWFALRDRAQRAA